ncbi:MAG TPA: phage major capsid protein [Tepidiformaceae bacterium]|nr:phage major capsid protein [Tepidiformaceae bacterium]
MAGNPNYDTALLTTTFNKFVSKQAADVIFNDLALFEYLNSKGSVKKRVDGGVKMLVHLMYGKNTAVQSYSGYDLLDVSPQEGLTNAEFELKQYNIPITISGREEELNAGEAQMIDLLESKWDQARMSLRDKLNADGFLDGTGNGGKNITGLALMVDSAGTYGNIPRATNSWWAAQETAVGGPLTIEGSTGMRRIYNDCSLGKGTMTPDGILTTQTLFEKYESLMAPYLRYSVGGDANAVFANDNLKFRKAMMFWDHECQSQTMYFLNSKVIEMRVKRDMQVVPFQVPINQDAKVAHIRWMGELVAKNCRHLGKLTGATE